MFNKTLSRVIATILLFTFTLTAFSGCASIFKGSHAEIRANSAPAGADIFIKGIDKGTTPQTLTLDRDQDYIIEFRKEGYEDVKVEVDKKFDFPTTILGNIVSWALLGIIVDLATGAAYSLTPADIEANLPKLKAAGLVPNNYKPAKNEIFVIMLSKKEWESVIK